MMKFSILHTPFLLLFAVLLSSCETERTVLSSESRMSFSEDWKQQTGDVKGLSDKFIGSLDANKSAAASLGIEERPGPKMKKMRIDGKKQEVAVVQRVKKYRTAERTQNEQAEAGPFEGIKSLTRKTSKDSGAKTNWANRTSNIREDFSTSEWGRAQEKFERVTNKDRTKVFSTNSSREAKQGFDFGSSRDSQMGLSAKRANAKTTIDSASQLRPGSAFMTEDEVHRMLHPERSAAAN